MTISSAKTKAAEERDLSIGERDSFPASDPNGVSADRGPRAVPVDQGAGEGPKVQDAVTLWRRFKDAETAKLALEDLVRSVPLDRKATTLDGSDLRLSVPRDDKARIEALLNQA